MKTHATRPRWPIARPRRTPRSPPRPIEKGLLIVHTGKGKGKSTAAFGLLLRALGRGFRVRRRAVRQGRLADRRARRASSASATRSNGTRWAKASPGRRRTARATSPRPSAPGPRRSELMADPAIRLIVLDELNIALRYDHLDARRGGRGAAGAPRRPARRRHRPQRQAGADRGGRPVTEMTPVKHHFAAGVKAQEGIEF